jgi:hypothetical protein
MRKRRAIWKTHTYNRKSGSPFHIQQSKPLFLKNYNTPRDTISHLHHALGNRIVGRMIRSGLLQTGPCIQKTPPTREELQQQLVELIMRRSMLELKVVWIKRGSVEPLADAISRRSNREDLARMRATARSERLTFPIPLSALNMMRKVIRISQSNTGVRLHARMEITFPGQSNVRGVQMAAREIPRIRQAILNSWTVQINSGPYRGISFILNPIITYRPPARARNPDAWQIIVRAQPGGASAGTWWNGIIDLNPDHLKGSEIVIVAHEVYHLFGYKDAYSSVQTGQRRRWIVGREDPGNRPDLLGMVSQKGLQRRLGINEITREQYDRQTVRTPTAWEEDVSVILQALAVPTPRQFQLNQTAEEIGSLRRELNSLEWIRTVEEIQQVNEQIEQILRQLGE